MIKEIYCKLPTDTNYEEKVESDDEIVNILQLIKVILGTTPYEVLGSPDFGVDIKQFLFTMNYNQDEIKMVIAQAITQHIRYNSKKYNIGVNVNFGHNHDSAYEYAVIDIEINEQKYMGILVSE